MDSLLLKKNLRIQGQDREFYISHISKHSCTNYLFISLHGLEQNGEISASTFVKFNQLGHELTKCNLLAVFPIGLQGCFPKQEMSLAWYPLSRNRNFFFLQKLIEHLKGSHKIEKTFLFGFSNGAYFASEILQSDECHHYFDGFWIQGGSSEIQATLKNRRSKIVLEVGEFDAWNHAAVKSAKKNLVAYGWKLGDNFVYRELKLDHTMDFSYLEENLVFFTQ
jgi:poly(3-hydroxybutyrate) depolymerase